MNSVENVRFEVLMTVKI